MPLLPDRTTRLIKYTCGMENPNVFAGAFVERSGERRKDTEWLRRTAASRDARFVAVWHDRCLVAGDPPGLALLQREQVREFIVDDELIFLGNFREQPAFAVTVTGDVAPLEGRGEFRDLRFLGTVLPLDEANLAAHARALVLWHASQVFCGVCGAAARPGAGGNSRICTSDGCGREIYPRVDPAIIVLVADGDRCLLGRQADWPEGRYSTIAGFAEPGESLEDAVRREVYEETNIRVGEVTYHSSQPWPFPSSLMIGFHARAASTKISLNDGELEDARWFTRAELLDGDHPLPFRISISRRLIDDWIGLGEED